jgi:hypothetical protein
VKGLVVPTEYDLEGLQNLSECGENKYTSQQGIELRSSSTFFSHYADWDIQNKKKTMKKSCVNIQRLRTRSRPNLLDYNVNRRLSVSRVHWHLFQIQNYGARLKISSYVNLTTVCNSTLSKWFIKKIWIKFIGSYRCTVATSMSTLGRCDQAEAQDSAQLKTELRFPS